jgi:glycosyltransferase involved in cell wall biosynthesis
MQDYNNYHVVYIDDASPDKTGTYVKQYIKERNIS